MPISKSDSLFTLIKSLTRGEKRHFRSFAQRESDGSSLKYLQLFDLLDKQSQLDESEIFDKFDRKQLPNLKRHLYSQIMVSLRLLHRQNVVPIQLREHFDFANILYSKGLYLQSLQLIQKAKAISQKINNEFMELQLTEFEKIIESRHITRTGTNKVKQLTSDTNQLIHNLNGRLHLSNLRLQLHGYYIEKGHVKSRESSEEVRSLYENQFIGIEIEQMQLIEQAYYYQSKVWFHFILLEMQECLINAKKCLELLNTDESRFFQRDLNLKMRAFHYVLTSLYHLGDVEQYEFYLSQFEKFRKDEYSKFNKNSQILSFIYVHNGRLNKFILLKQYSEGLLAIPKTLMRIKRYKTHLDAHRILVLHYKISLIYIMAGMPEKSVSFLHGIISTRYHNLRSDIQGYARIAFLMAHFDMKNFDVVSSNIRSVQNFLKKNVVDSRVTDIMMQFFKKATSRPENKLNELKGNLHIELQAQWSNMYERRGILYLHALEWAKPSI